MAGQETIAEQERPRAREWSPTDEHGKHKDSRRIEQDIDQVRHDMDTTLDALGERWHPRHLFSYVLDLFQYRQDREQARHAARELGDKALHVAHGNPLPAVLIGAGVGWLAWSMQQHDGGRAASALSAAQQKGAEAMGKAKSTVESARQGAESMAGKAGEYRQQAQARRERARESYDKGLGESRRLMDEHPLAVGVAALGAGILGGILFRPTGAEREALGKPSEKVKEKAEPAVAGAAEAAERSAEAAAEAAGEKAEEERRGTGEEEKPKAKA